MYVSTLLPDFWIIIRVTSETEIRAAVKAKIVYILYNAILCRQVIPKGLTEG